MYVSSCRVGYRGRRYYRSLQCQEARDVERPLFLIVWSGTDCKAECFICCQQICHPDFCRSGSFYLRRYTPWVIVKGPIDSRQAGCSPQSVGHRVSLGCSLFLGFWVSPGRCSPQSVGYRVSLGCSLFLGFWVSPGRCSPQSVG